MVINYLVNPDGTEWGGDNFTVVLQHNIFQSNTANLGGGAIRFSKIGLNISKE